ncbi:MAG: DUF3102 domain-containing protein [Planctomycetota bacterium]
MNEIAETKLEELTPEMLKSMSARRLIESATEHAGFFRRFIRLGLAHAIRAGVLLNEAKSRCKHGEWQAWLDDWGTVSRRQARKYMQVARYRNEIEGAETIGEALLIINRLEDGDAATGADPKNGLKAVLAKPDDAQPESPPTEANARSRAFGDKARNRQACRSSTETPLTIDAKATPTVTTSRPAESLSDPAPTPVVVADADQRSIAVVSDQAIPVEEDDNFELGIQLITARSQGLAEWRDAVERIAGGDNARALGLMALAESGVGGWDDASDRFAASWRDRFSHEDRKVERMIEAGRAFIQIRDRRLYREFGTWGEYLSSRGHDPTFVEMAIELATRHGAAE